MHLPKVRSRASRPKLDIFYIGAQGQRYNSFRLPSALCVQLCRIVSLFRPIDDNNQQV
jgi:hypothetical protein